MAAESGSAPASPVSAPPLALTPTPCPTYFTLPLSPIHPKPPTCARRRASSHPVAAISDPRCPPPNTDWLQLNPLPLSLTRSLALASVAAAIAPSLLDRRRPSPFHPPMTGRRCPSPCGRRRGARDVAVDGRGQGHPDRANLRRRPDHGRSAQGPDRHARGHAQGIRAGRPGRAGDVAPAAAREHCGRAARGAELARFDQEGQRTATSTSFLTVSHGFIGSMPPSLHSPCDILYLVFMLIGCWLMLAIRWDAQFTSSGRAGAPG